ncbi:hypothetical protein [Carnimonas nigrificans]|uniref:hypothetical protein n=1 Tax=Carnimonas nigrificans TaxID=64323 RepID=UPI0004B1E64C|nr:hypothetical protein [Carnimonas nigrificans]
MEQLTVHFTSNDDDIIEICSKYWMLSSRGSWKSTVSEIAHFYGLPVYKLSQLVKESSYVLDSTRLCQRCSSPYMARVRSDMPISSLGVTSNKPRDFTCTKCLEADRAEQEKKKAVEQALANERIECYRAELEVRVNDLREHTTSVDVLPGYYSIVLLALIKHSGSEALEYIDPINKNSIDALTPSDQFTVELLNELQEVDIITISPRSPSESLIVTPEGEKRYYPLGVAWEVGVSMSLTDSVDLAAAYSWLNNYVSMREFRESSWGGILHLGRRVVLEEALAYLNLELGRRGFPEREGEKTIAALKEALSHFSLSQVCWIISNQLRHVSDRYRQGQSYGLPHASNQVISGISKYTERAVANQWDVTRFKRDYDQPQSVISRVIFNHILKVDDGGFYHNLDELFSQFEENNVYINNLKNGDIPF